MDSCFKSLPTVSGAAVELYTPFATSPPNQMTISLSPQTPLPISSIFSSLPTTTTSSTSRTSTSSPSQPTPIAFFSVNRSDHVQQKQNSSQQQQNNTSMIDSSAGDMENLLTIQQCLETNGLNPSTTPILGQVTEKEYCQAKKSNNRFNVPLRTKFYRVHVKPWKPSITSSSSSN